jgi:hypothetical protein
MRALLLMSGLALAMPAPAQAPPSHAIAGDWHGTGLQVGPEDVQSSWTIQLSITAAGAALHGEERTSILVLDAPRNAG